MIVLAFYASVAFGVAAVGAWACELLDARERRAQRRRDRLRLRRRAWIEVNEIGGDR